MTIAPRRQGQQQLLSQNSTQAGLELTTNNFFFFAATPKKGMASLVALSPSVTNGDDSFTEPRGGFRTPTLCVRRPSLKMKAASFLGVSKK
jgi:hypothetical protein